MWPQSGELLVGLAEAAYGVPGPEHVTERPSPNAHTTEVGRATAVTDTPGTDAVADTGPQPARSTHSQVGRPTNCSPAAGFTSIRGDGSPNWLYATWASSAALGSATAPGFCVASGIHTGGRYTASRTPPCVHLYTYQAPESPGVG